jgi:hypothetical protein
MQAQLQQVLGVPGNIRVDPNDALPIILVPLKDLGDYFVPGHGNKRMVGQEQDIQFQSVALEQGARFNQGVGVVNRDVATISRCRDYNTVCLPGFVLFAHLRLL